MYKSIVYGVFIKAFNCQINHQVKTRCTDFPEAAGNCTKESLVLSHCAILDANGEVHDEKKCECSFHKLGNIFLPKNCTEICQNFEEVLGAVFESRIRDYFSIINEPPTQVS